MALQGFNDWTPTAQQAQILAQMNARAQYLRQSGAPADENDPVIKQLAAQLAQSNGGSLNKDMFPAIGQALTGDKDFMTRTGLGDFLSKATEVAGSVAGGYILKGLFDKSKDSSSSSSSSSSPASTPTEGGYVPGSDADPNVGTPGYSPSAPPTPGSPSVPTGSGNSGNSTNSTNSGNSIWNDIARGAVPAVANIVGTQIAASAQNNATAAQSQAAQNALDWAKSVYAQRRTDLSNQIGLGSGASARLSQLYGFPVGAPASTSSGEPLATLGSPQAAPAVSSQPSPTGGMVTLRAPDGSTKQFSQQDAQAWMQHYPQAGLQIVST